MVNVIVMFKRKLLQLSITILIHKYVNQFNSLTDSIINISILKCVQILIRSTVRSGCAIIFYDYFESHNILPHITLMT